MSMNVPITKRVLSTTVETHVICLFFVVLGQSVKHLVTNRHADVQTDGVESQQTDVLSVCIFGYYSIYVFPYIVI